MFAPRSRNSRTITSDSSRCANATARDSRPPTAAVQSQSARLNDDCGSLPRVPSDELHHRTHQAEPSLPDHHNARANARANSTKLQLLRLASRNQKLHLDCASTRRFRASSGG